MANERPAPTFSDTSASPALLRLMRHRAREFLWSPLADGGVRVRYFNGARCVPVDFTKWYLGRARRSIAAEEQLVRLMDGRDEEE